MARYLVLLMLGFVLGQAQAQYAAGACGMRAPGNCFMSGSYDPGTKSFCCSGNVYPCDKPAEFACCGKGLVQRNLYLCCSNDPMPKAPGTACCDKMPIDMASMVCCDGEARPKMGPNTKCCGKRPYDTEQQVCCNKDVELKANAQYNLACSTGNDAPPSIALPTSPTASGAAGGGSGGNGGGGGGHPPPHAHPFVNGPPRVPGFGHVMPSPPAPPPGFPGLPVRPSAVPPRGGNPMPPSLPPFAQMHRIQEFLAKHRPAPPPGPSNQGPPARG